MMSCDFFRTNFQAATEDAALLGHLRTCDRCLDFAASVDPDVMFRALGGDDLVPPGGVEAFVDDVMRQVRVRDAEKTVVSFPRRNWTRRLAVAATFAVAVTGASLAYRYQEAIPASMLAQVSRAQITTRALTTKPVIETYQSDSATILEVPTESNDVKIVMIFDENLPADL